MSELQIKEGSPLVETGILKLYRAVSRVPHSLARTDDEIHLPYIENWMQKSLLHGLWLTGEIDHQVIASIHAYRPEPKAFWHVLRETTLVVHPDYHSRGYGYEMLKTFVDTIRREHTKITRLELLVHESNQKAIGVYEKAGFVREGRMLHRIRHSDGELEADIPMAWYR